MIKNEETYCTVQHKIVRELGAWEAVVYATIANLLRKTDGIGEVSNQTLMDLCGINNKMSLYRYIDKLIKAGYLEKREGKGRGNISIYYITKKGNNLLPISDKKGNKNDTEKVTKMNEKGNNLLPLNKGINKEIKESGGETRAHASSPTLNTTHTFSEIENFNNNTQNETAMSEFTEFWKLYPFAEEFANEEENCERVWFAMPEEWKEKLLAQLRSGKRWREREHDNPYWYLKNYNGEDMQMELPFFRQGTKTFGKWIAAAERENIPVVIIRYPEDGHIAYCYKSDLQTMLDAGAVFIRDYEYLKN